MSSRPVTTCVTYAVWADDLGGHWYGADEQDSRSGAEKHSRDDDEERTEMTVCDDGQPDARRTRQ